MKISFYPSLLIVAFGLSSNYAFGACSDPYVKCADNDCACLEKLTQQYKECAEEKCAADPKKCGPANLVYEQQKAKSDNCKANKAAKK